MAPTEKAIVGWICVNGLQEFWIRGAMALSSMPPSKTQLSLILYFNYHSCNIENKQCCISIVFSIALITDWGQNLTIKLEKETSKLFSWEQKLQMNLAESRTEYSKPTKQNTHKHLWEAVCFLSHMESIYYWQKLSRICCCKLVALYSVFIVMLQFI